MVRVMIGTVTKIFEFSASFARDKKVMGHNYTLRATFLAPDMRTEEGLVEKIETSLIRKVHSRDLGMHVDFLRGVALDDPSLLKAFWAVLEPAVRPVALQSLSLQRDRGTLWTLSVED